MISTLTFVVQFPAANFRVQGNCRGYMALGDLISLKGLITVSAILSVTIKYLHITLNVNRNNVNVNGNNNNVTVVYNDALASTQRNFSLLWNLLAVGVFLTYPIWGGAYNFFLGALAYVGVPIALVALVGHCIRYGVARRIWDLFYVIGAAVVCLLALGAAPFLDYTASQAGPIYANVVATIDLFSKGVNLFSILPFFAKYVGYPLISVMGFSFFFLSVVYLVFAFIKERDFNDSLRFSISQVGMGAMGYILACNVFVALFLQDFGYITRVIVSPFWLFLS